MLLCTDGGLEYRSSGVHKYIYFISPTKTIISKRYSFEHRKYDKYHKVKNWRMKFDFGMSHVLFSNTPKHSYISYISNNLFRS